MAKPVAPRRTARKAGSGSGSRVRSRKRCRTLGSKAGKNVKDVFSRGLKPECDRKQRIGKNDQGIEAGIFMTPKELLSQSRNVKAKNTLNPLLGRWMPNSKPESL